MSCFRTHLAVLIVGISIPYGCAKDETTAPPPSSPQNSAPTVPTNPIPANNASAQPFSLAMYWDVCTDPENDPVTYDVYFGTPPTPALVASNLTTPGYGSGGLSAMTAYLWKVVAKDNRGGSTIGPVWSFTTAAVGPTEPVLLSPANNDTGVAIPPTLSWHASPGATRYALQVSSSSSFATFVYYDSNLTSTSQQVPLALYNTTYYWRVRASNSYGASLWSVPTWQFRTGNPVPCPGMPTVTYAGKAYNTVLIGTQCWLRENVEIGTMVPVSQNQTNNGTIEKYCYDDNPANCITYGGLYQWNEAMQYDTTPGSRGICPPGWHIPTFSEFQTLRSTVGGNGNALKAIGQGSGSGQGTNESGFSALLAGYRGDPLFVGLGNSGVFWNSTQNGATEAHYLALDYSNPNIYLSSLYKTFGFSVRCLKD